MIPVALNDNSITVALVATCLCWLSPCWGQKMPIFLLFYWVRVQLWGQTLASILYCLDLDARAGKQEKTYTLCAGLQPCRQPWGQPEWCFYGWAYLLLQAAPRHWFPYWKCQLNDRCHTTHTHTLGHMLTHARTALHLFSRQGGNPGLAFRAHWGIL